MSLQRLNKIIMRAVQLLLYPQIHSLPKLDVVQKFIANVPPRIGIQTSKHSKFLLRNNLFRISRTLRHRHLFIRPFATLKFHNHLKEFEKSQGLLLFKISKKRDIMEQVRHLFGTNVRYNRALAISKMPDNLDGYEIGKFIACGCNGAVHELKLRSDKHICTGNHSNMDFPLALKIMFNYDFHAPDYVIWRQMGTELVPLPSMPKALLYCGKMANLKNLPRYHPNIIKMYTAFIDRMPILPESEKFYPDALPNIQDCELLNGPKTLHLVMKRYRMTLYNYLRTNNISNKNKLWVGQILLGQLLEAIVYLHQNKICHRDMKSDNILLDFDDADEIPNLALSDFGSALATGNWNMHYKDDTVDLGGNIALRAPEIRRVSPGTMINFEMADTWASGTLALELFIGRNPFYNVLNSGTYSEADLPPLPMQLIEPIKLLVKEMLCIDPKNRPKPAISANVIAISLFRFGQDIHSFMRNSGMCLSCLPFEDTLSRIWSKINERMENKLREIAELFATETISLRLMDSPKISSAELQLRATFLSRLNKEELQSALAYFAKTI